MNYRIVLYAKSSKFGLIAVAVTGIAFLALVLMYDGPVEFLRVLPLPLAVVAFTAWMWVWPRVIIENSGVTLRNQLRVIHLPWETLEKAEPRFGLYLLCRDSNGGAREFYAAAVPSKAKRAGSTSEAGRDFPVHVAESASTVKISLDPGDASRLINDEIRYRKHPSQRPKDWRFTDAPANSGAGNKDARITWNWVFPVALAALVALSILAIGSR